MKEATAAADAWLAEVDRGEFGASWDHMAGLAQAAVPKAQWEQTLATLHTQLGAPSRTLSAASFTTTLPGAPAGEYVVIQYKTRFDKLPANMVGIETVTPMRDKDGKWRVSGYYVRPEPIPSSDTKH